MEKIKQFYESEKGKDLMIILIIIFIGLSSFILGRLSKENAQDGIKIKYLDQEANVLGSLEPVNALVNSNTRNDTNTPQNSLKSNGGAYFASNRGSKYYPVNCSAGKTIKVENRVYFNSSSEAENAGYTLSSSCQ